VPGAKAAGAWKQVHLAKPNAFVEKIHDEGFYLIGRVTVFQDPLFAALHPEWALKDKATGKMWRDKNGLPWLDPAATSTWEYAAGIGRDLLRRGFDEVNFDYVRFASDGNVNNVAFPVWDGVVPKSAVIKSFFAYLRDALPGARISADLFGLVTVEPGDIGVGQRLEDSFPYFAAVAPMVYLSHFGPGFFGFKNPAERPYEVISHSMQKAVNRLAQYMEGINNANAATSSSRPLSSLSVALRPWLQYFDLGARYTPEMVKLQIRATEEAAATSTMQGTIGGWMLWDPTNTYPGITQLEQKKTNNKL
jgi:hypothetical protein